MTSHQWGRVDDDGTVFVKTAEGERSVGQYPEGSPEEALKFFTERYAALAFEVDLLEQRIKSGVLSPEEAVESVKTVATQVSDANAVGDLASLLARLEALTPVIETQREARKVEKAQRSAESRAQKEKIVAEAEKLAEGHDWRNGANRLRELLDEWKALPGSTGPPTTPSGDGSRPRARRTLGAASRTSRSSTSSGTRPGRSRSGSRPRPRAWPPPPSGARPPAATAT